MKANILKALGMMSGTSADGVDIALIETDGERITAFGPAETFAYDDRTRTAIRAAMAEAADLPATPAIPGDLAEISALVADRHRAAVDAFLGKHGIARSGIDILGFHGQTLRHWPERQLTWQVGDAETLASVTEIDVVADFRRADVLAGGQGAPFAPLYHAALLRSEAAAIHQPAAWPVAVLNLGGVGNVTWVNGPEELLAFDTGPGNALVDDWVREHGAGHFDDGGRIAAKGRVHEPLVEFWMANDFFRVKPPKSLDRDDFRNSRPTDLGLEDGAATLTAFTAASVAEARRHMLDEPKAWYVCGGGRHNPTLMTMLKERLGVTVLPVEALGWRGDSLEAEAFAFLAVRSLRGLPLSLPTTTGVPEPLTGGRIVRAKHGAAVV